MKKSDVFLCVLQPPSSQGNRPESSLSFNPYEPDRRPWVSERGERCPFRHQSVAAGWGGLYSLPHDEVATSTMFLKAAPFERLVLVVLIPLNIHEEDVCVQ